MEKVRPSLNPYPARVSGVSLVPGSTPTPPQTSSALRDPAFPAHQTWIPDSPSCSAPNPAS